MSVLENFGQWKKFLNNRMEKGKNIGVNEDTMTNFAAEIGDYLAQNVDPKNDEERLLKELWDAGDQEEQKTIAHLMMKLVQKDEQ